jgi:hypothetical protein
MNLQTADDEPNEFAALDTLDLIAAFLFQKYGEGALREAFSQAGFYHEPLVQVADILDGRGLAHIADIVADIA